MTFIRTPLGLSNQYLFHGVDAIVFLEGGKDTFSVKQVQSGLQNTQSIDILFWQRLFSLFLPDKKLRFSPIGSKSTLKQIANDIKSGKISHVYVAMDRDQDKFLGSLIESSGVLYTYGYSWENDVFNNFVTQCLFTTLCPVSLDGIDYITFFNSLFEDFTRDIRWAVYADILLALHGLSLFPRIRRPEFLLKSDPDGKPLVNRQKILTLIRNAKARRRSKIFFGTKITFLPCVDCYGHLLAIYSYRSLIYVLKKHSDIPDLPKYYAYASAINKFCENISQAPLSNYYTHYHVQFSSLT